MPQWKTIIIVAVLVAMAVNNRADTRVKKIMKMRTMMNTKMMRNMMRTTIADMEARVGDNSEVREAATEVTRGKEVAGVREGMVKKKKTMRMKMKIMKKRRGAEAAMEMKEVGMAITRQEMEAVAWVGIAAMMKTMMKRIMTTKKIMTKTKMTIVGAGEESVEVQVVVHAEDLAQ